MAKKSMLMRESKRAKLVEKYRQRRNELKQLIKSSDDFQVIMESQAKLAKLPVNSNPVRYVTRCKQCGRPHAVYRKFNLCRICLRQQLMVGNVPGGRKSSW
ncbi:TPA: 30S ribosomal protein S14 [Legionella pneumophila subsp. pneumophila]|uniref:Small ribosomal subunit protein uS14 n=2 Tax=Legionella pneumophila TaxID=446 RepID=A0A2S6F5J3_LEGPN|nr:30S ribosomal protein S14 [Legionella pneumophila]AMP88498.1 30S ribosomal protein S14 [Legionella pneumophila subsp. pascullei]AMP91407.1 30S ribosomal protein S14 [Legionella pneumophila subsp. pascullei]AMP94395.1 30S ribosomal protein S14 [Legionella pneumophila subsp. pascullei]APF02201.1 30S ribosomal protein S14 [Legionella pneumophila subsp. fraseri]APF05210.1 30S ribosomal protein S14 [Legionella pneumophila subsp. fraseri]